MSFVDGMIAAVPADSKDAFIEYSKRTGEVFKALGATAVVDCWGETVPDGEVTSFPLAVKKKDDEVVVFSWVEWPSREARDAGWKKFEEDPSIFERLGEMPFDGKRMIYGGFERIVGP